MISIDQVQKWLRSKDFDELEDHKSYVIINVKELIADDNLSHRQGLKEFIDFLTFDKDFESAYALAQPVVDKLYDLENFKPAYANILGKRRKVAELEKYIEKLEDDLEVPTHIVIKAMFHMASAYYDDKQYAKSLEVIEDLHEMGKENPKTRLLYAKNLIELLRYDEAKEYLTSKLSVKDPFHVKYLKLIRNIHMYHMDTEKIFESYLEIAKYEKAKKLNFRHIIGTGLRMGRPHDILRLFEQFAEQNSNPQSLVENKGNLLTKQHKYSEALEYWDQLLSDNPGHEQAIYQKVNCLVYLHRFDDANAFLDEKLAAYPKSKLVLLSKIFYCRKLYFRKEAVEWCDKALALYPDDTGMLKEAISTNLDLNELEKATGYIEHLDKLLVIPFQNFQNRLNYLTESDQFEEAIKYIDDSISKFPKNRLQILIKQASLYFHPGLMKSSHDAVKAASMTESFLEEYPMSVDLKLTLIRIYIFLHRYDEAAAIASQVPEHMRFHQQADQIKSWEAMHNGDLDTAKANWKELICRRDIVPVYSPITDFRLLSTELEMTSDDLILFSVVRDEHYRLQGFLDYYRKLGITKFVFIDNGSSDGTDKILLSEPDVILWQTDNTYTQSFNGMRWVNELIEKYTKETKNWCFYIDVDEYLIYPEVESKDLRQLTNYLESNGYEAMRGFMLDVFDPETFEITIDQGNPLDKSLYFFNKYNLSGWEFSPYCRVSGGLRTQLYDSLNIILTKTPVIKGGGDIKFLASSHIITPAKIADITSAFIHLKYSSEFIGRAKVEAERKVHFKGAKRFKLYYEKRDEFKKVMDDFEDNPDFVEFKNSRQLVELGLIKGQLS